MKKVVIVFLVLLIIIGIIFGGIYIKNNTNNSNQKNENNEIFVEEQVDKNSISYTGWLKTEGSQLLNEKGEQIQLRGLSSHGIQWFPEVLTEENIKELKDNWNINVFRIAMYTDPEANGYIAHPEQSKEFVNKIVECAIKNDMYVIIDWHILNDKNPQIYEQQSKEFFEEMSKKYSETPNVIYEICNEPNGQEVKWDYNVKPYAENIIKIIRNNSPKSLIIVGTPDWCKDLASVANNPINEKNIIYSCHFYAGTHGEELRKQIDYCREKNIPIFISECGITEASGNGKIYEEKFNEWINYINKNNLSWIFWSFCNKEESSSILTKEYKIEKTENTTEDSEKNNEKIEENNQKNEEKNINNYLTNTGKIIKNILTSYK